MFTAETRNAPIIANEHHSVSFCRRFMARRSKENGRRLGYMGHLIYMFDSLNLLVLVSHQFRALVESNLTEDELSYWKLVTDPTNGYLVSALKAQKSYLGGIDPNQSDSYDTSASKDFQDESFTGDYYNDIEANSHNMDDINDAASRLFETTCSMRNLSTFDIRDTDIKYNFDELMNEFRDDISDNNIFGSGVGDGGGGGGGGIGSQTYASTNSNPLLPKNETDWADFDSHFSDFQLSDNNAFPPLEQNHANRNNESKPNAHANSPQSSMPPGSYGWNSSEAEKFSVASGRGEAAVGVVEMIYICVYFF